jgi:preprotein translocase subunit SecG
LITRIRRWIARRRWGVAAAITTLLAVVVRGALVATGWPGTDSDDATMGLMAKHIVALGDRPIFFYGQSYMGSIEAYAAALAFAFLGVSEFALKCGLILLYACFMVIMYGFLIQITSRAWALAGEAILALGADEMLYHQLEAYGGYLETLIFGASLLALTCWLVRAQGDPRYARRSTWAFAGWGLAAGLGLWSDVLVAPFVVLTAGALALFCWPAVRRRGALLAVSCLLLGISPWIIYLATPAPPAPRGLIQSSTPLPASPAGPEPGVVASLTNQFLGMALISLPNDTGATTLCPLTPDEAWPQDHWTTPRIRQCVGFRAVWGGTFLCLLALGLALEARSVLRLWRRTRDAVSSPHRAELACSVGRLLGLGAPAMTIALFTLSSAAAFAPWVYSRYLISVTIATPTLLATLWTHAVRIAAARDLTRSSRRLAATSANWLARVSVVGLSAFTLIALALGTIGTYRASDAQQAQNQVRADLVAYLTRNGETRVYTEFWTCYWVIFQSDERVICGVLNADWSHRPSRYAAYDAAIRAAQPSTYVFPLHSTWADTFDSVAAQQRWRIEQKTVIDQQYVVFVVAPSSP